jgi:Uma2 family endonuclease
MSQQLTEAPVDLKEVIENLVTEDDEPVDNLFSAKQQRLLVQSLYSSWTPPRKEDQPAGEQRKFLADTNVGVFFSPYQPPVVPDFFLSLDVEPHPDVHAKEHRSYFIWEFLKAPDVALEVVSNRKGGELSSKLKIYEKIDVTYYVVFDPLRLLSEDELRVHERGFGRRYRLRDDYQLPEVGLNLILWSGVYEDFEDTWLRWCDLEGHLILTGQERAATAEERVESEATARRKAEQRVAQLTARLEELGGDGGGNK